MSVLRCVRAADVAAGMREDAAAVDVMCVLMLVRSVGGDERNAAASSILESIKRDSDRDFAEVQQRLFCS